MSSPIHIEPSDANRSAFALWCLAQTPPIGTSSHAGFDVPADLFTGMPGELLDGAYVDGHVYRHVVEGKVPHGDGYADERPVAAPRVARRARKGADT